MPAQTVGIFSPGKMGRTIGRALAKSGHRIIYSSEGRSDGTRRHAENLGFLDAETNERLFKKSDILFCIGTNGLYGIGAELAISYGYQGIYVDANSISNESEEKALAAKLHTAGINYVDCALRGQPLGESNWGRTMFLYGNEAERIAPMFTDGMWSVNVCKRSAKEIVRLIDTPEIAQ
jgi:3-hydroxyisobutyrate dehydrogenase-like beta-hydroxyacid dehydrogenase